MVFFCLLRDKIGKIVVFNFKSFMIFYIFTSVQRLYLSEFSINYVKKLLFIIYYYRKNLINSSNSLRSVCMKRK